MTKVTSMLSTTTITTTARPTAYSNGNERIVYRKKQKERSRTINLTPRNYAPPWHGVVTIIKAYKLFAFGGCGEGTCGSSSMDKHIY